MWDVLVVRVKDEEVGEECGGVVVLVRVRDSKAIVKRSQNDGIAIAKLLQRVCKEIA